MTAIKTNTEWNRKMDFAEASAFVMNFGKTTKGQTLAAVATTDEGLQLLEKLKLQRSSKESGVGVDDLDKALATYFASPTIAARLSAVKAK